MEQFSFDFRDPYYQIDGWEIGLRVITFENTYTLDPDRTRLAGAAGDWDIVAERLMWAGGQEKCPGGARIRARKIAGGLQLDIWAHHPKKIRCTVAMIRGLPRGTFIGARWSEEEVSQYGALCNYPYPEHHTPLVFVREGDEYFYFRSRDSVVRAKRFAVRPEGGGLTVELIHEDAAHEMTNETIVPSWQIGRTCKPDDMIAAHLAEREQQLSLLPWEERPDVPEWAKEIALAVCVHGMHWSGYVFNTYAQMLEAFQWIAERIEGRRILGFLPGWEGRYYWQYGDYRPEPRLGGVEGFRRLCEGAQELGIHLMPMFGGNCANTGIENFEQWGAQSHLVTAGGLIVQGNKPDWDNSRAHDTGWQAWLNPGAPGWQNRLVQQIGDLVEEYRLPAAFLDTHGRWVNDPRHPVYPGLVALKDRLRARFPDLLLAGEHYYDALGAVTPVCRTGVPSRWPGFFGRHNRVFANVSGDPSRGSTGVYELGTYEFNLVPDEPHWWPTLTIVDGTITEAPDKAEQVIDQARAYVEKHLRRVNS